MSVQRDICVHKTKWRDLCHVDQDSSSLLLNRLHVAPVLMDISQTIRVLMYASSCQTDTTLWLQRALHYHVGEEHTQLLIKQDVELVLQGRSLLLSHFNLFL